MSTTDCTETHRALLAGETLPEGHLDACAACADFATRLATVDDALDRDGAAAEDARLPDALRNRILSAARPASAPAPSNGRLLDLGLRLAAVAAMLVAAVLAMPDTAWAAEIDFGAVDQWPTHLTSVLPESPQVALPDLAAGVPVPEPSNPLPLAAGAVALLAAGFFTLRKDAR